MRSLRPLVLFAASGVAAVIACGAPDSFNGLVGGIPDAGPESAFERRPDPTLVAARPIAPISVSWVNTARPRFRWALTPGATGARLELCRARFLTDGTCAAESKTFEATGTELVSPEELAPGIWFWRLFSTTPDTFGTVAGPVWEVLVRGPLASPVDAGVASASNGTFVDVNGDGRVDLLASVEINVQGAPAFELVAFLGKGDDGTTFITTGDDPDFPPQGAFIGQSDTSISGADIDGDGISDVVYADASRNTSLFSVAGSPTGLALDRVSFVDLPPLDSFPSLHEAGDLDGDGWADVIVGTRFSAFASFGTRLGLGPFVAVVQTGFSGDAGAFITRPFAVTGGFDRNGDGLGDLAFSEPLDEAPFFLVQGEAERKFAPIFPVLTTLPFPTAVQHIVTGDFDGDGLADIAFVGSFGDQPTACVAAGKDPPSAQSIRCLTPAPAPVGFGSSITACDLDADGRDELLIGSTSGGVDVARLVPGAPTLSSERIPGSYGARLTTILPGRPGAGVWAATRADGLSIAVFKGTAQVTTLLPNPGLKRFGEALR